MRIGRAAILTGITWLAGALAAGFLAATPAAAQPTAQPNWIKFCSPGAAGAAETCIVVQQVMASNGVFIASADIRWEAGSNAYQLVIAVPNGMMIPPGVRIQIDGANPIDVPYLVCYGTRAGVSLERCYAQRPVDTAFINSLKRGGELTLSVINNDTEQQMSFALTLSGFTAAFDGPATDPAAAQEALAGDQAAADAARQRLIDLQNQ